MVHRTFACRFQWPINLRINLQDFYPTNCEVASFFFVRKRMLALVYNFTKNYMNHTCTVL